jgi:FixJ family two-component response regulator
MVDTNTTIMVIDDDDLVRDSLKTLLKSAGFKAEVFDSAERFLNSGCHLIDSLLVLDIQMPGMNGLELQGHLAKAGVAIPIVFITAHEDDKACTMAMDLGAVAVLQKPFEDSTLLDAIQGVLG